MSTKQITIKDIGTVTLIKKNRTKSINIRIIPFKGVRVSLPDYISFKEAEDVVKNKIDWIKKHQEKVRRMENEKTVFDENTNFRTRKHRLIINKYDEDKIKARIFNGEINVYYPENVDIKNESVQFMIKRAIEEALRIEAKMYLPQRVNKFAKKYGFEYNKIFVKNIKSRWGSCSKKGNVNLSLHLMRLPDELIDYVILHELAHTIEQNHSKKFWSILDSIYGNAKIIDKKLNNYSAKVW